MSTLIGSLKLKVAAAAMLFAGSVYFSNRYFTSKYSTENQYTPPPVTYISEQELFEIIQAWRQETGRPFYIEDQDLCEVAAIRAKEIQTEFSHKKFNGRRFTNRDYYSIGENIASWTWDNAGSMFRAWLASPSHRKNLEQPEFKYSCVRCDNNYCAHLFSQFPIKIK